MFRKINKIEKIKAKNGFFHPKNKKKQNEKTPETMKNEAKNSVKITILYPILIFLSEEKILHDLEKGYYENKKRYILRKRKKHYKNKKETIQKKKRNVLKTRKERYKSKKGVL